MTQGAITARIAASGINAIALPHVDAAPMIGEMLWADDVLLLLTFGAFGGLIEALPLSRGGFFLRSSDGAIVIASEGTSKAQLAVRRSPARDHSPRSQILESRRFELNRFSFPGARDPRRRLAVERRISLRKRRRTSRKGPSRCAQASWHIGERAPERRSAPRRIDDGENTPPI